ncbi:alpha/beta hydrolase [Ktedonobacteria bacterium brp13]|nr:alpha/beta hydrolase [Ktedonobacteria bacterium brp13]
MSTETEKTFTADETGSQPHWFKRQLRASATERSKRGALLYWAVLLTLSAVVMHGTAILNQLPPSTLLAILLVGFTIVQALVAIAAVTIPARRFLLTAGVVEAVGMLVWIIAHAFGLPDGSTVWRPETLAVPDLYIPLVEGLSAVFFLCLWGRTLNTTSRVWRITFAILPRLLLLVLLIGVVVKSITLVVFFLVPGVFSSLQDFFLPVVGLFAVFLILRQIIKPLRIKTPRAWRTTFILLPAFLVLGLLTWGGGVSAIDTAWLPASTSVNVPAGQTATLSYCNSSNGSPLAMDISEPATQTSRPAPMVIYIHGGETLVGSRVLEDGTLDGMYFDQLRTELLKRGFIVGSLDYSLVPITSSGAQVTEAKCAVRFLRAHASALGLDQNRIGVYGPSQGGYISAMLGTTGPNTSYDVGQYLNQSSRVQAVVDMWGPTDLSNFSGSPWWASLLAGNATTAQLRNASPAYHVAHSDPPFLIMHGTDDWFIAPHHSQNMAKKLQAAGVPVTLVMIQHDSHGLAVPTAGQVEQPAPSTLIQMIADFFSKNLAA